MNTIIIYGNKKDITITKPLLQVLSSAFSINLISTKLISCGNLLKDKLNIIETADLTEISIKNSILIIKKNANIKPLKFIDKSTSVIISSENVKTIIKLSKTLSRVYSCGFSSKDYITFSSKNEDRAVVSLQRSITTVKEEICEPLEMPCIINNDIDDYSVLAIAITSILLNIF